MHQFTFEEKHRQLMLLALAKLALSRPGFDDVLGEMARVLRGREMYDAFKAHGPFPEPEAFQQLMAPGMLDRWEIRGAHCLVELTPRPGYCNRGNFLANIDYWPPLELEANDGWPRYYMGLDRAQREIEAWMNKRGEWVEGAKWEMKTEGGSDAG